MVSQHLKYRKSLMSEVKDYDTRFAFEQRDYIYEIYPECIIPELGNLRWL